LKNENYECGQNKKILPSIKEEEKAEENDIDYLNF
jgi:hypothetical protein